MKLEVKGKKCERSNELPYVEPDEGVLYKNNVTQGAEVAERKNRLEI